MPLSIDEITIIKLYNSEMDRDKTIEAIKAGIPFTEEDYIKDIMERVIRKITAMTEKDFAEIDLSEAIDSEV